MAKECTDLVGMGLVQLGRVGAVVVRLGSGGCRFKWVAWKRRDRAE